MVNETLIKKITDACLKSGYEIRVRDIAYIYLRRHFSDPMIAYKSVFGVDSVNIDNYENSSKMSYLKNYIEHNIESSKKVDASSITFDENKREMERLLVQTQQALDDGLIEAKDGLKILADIRVKLNDKFNIQDDLKDNMVIIETKFNSICPYCNHETYIPTKADLIKKYNLKEI